jgi:hypothetical protein
VGKVALFMEKCNVIRVTSAFSRKKAFNYERARRLELKKKGELFLSSYRTSK